MARQNGIRFTLTSTRRSYATQLALYLRYLKGQSKYPAAPPGRSFHESGRAFDIETNDGALRYLGAVWESWGGRWGGRFNDPIHFEA